MTIDDSIEREIRRLFFIEHWKFGTISAQLGVHTDVIRRATGLCHTPKERQARVLLLAPYQPLIDEHLAKYPRLVATRLMDMCVGRGYAGSLSTLRDYVRHVRPRSSREVFVRTETLAGEQAQIDWGHVGTLLIDGQKRALWAFVMVLAHSRAMFAELVLEMDVHSLRRSLVRAALFFGGNTRQWLFDNPKIVVLQRDGDLVQFHPQLLDVAGAFYVQPRLCGVRKPNQKGKVERSIRFLKERFFAARTIHSIDDGNRELLEFIDKIAHARPHPWQENRSVSDVFLEEKERLLKLPERLPTTDRIDSVMVDKTACIRFGGNWYSVPPDHAYKTLTLVASDTEVRVLDGADVVAHHRRRWGVRQRIELPEHRKAILARKHGAKDGQGRKRLLAEVPESETLMNKWLEQGKIIGLMIGRTIVNLNLYGQTTLRHAVHEMLARGTTDIGAMALLCEQHRRKTHAVGMAPVLGDHVLERDVLEHDLGGYDHE